MTLEQGRVKVWVEVISLLPGNEFIGYEVDLGEA